MRFGLTDTPSPENNWPMLFESKHIQLTAEHGTATLAFGFPGRLPNPFNLARLQELDRALAAMEAARSIRIVVVRSSNPNGFCAGLSPDFQFGPSDPNDRAAFAWYGQQVFDRLARLEALTLALIDGPCLGVGLELALACDFRLCVARPTTSLGFPDRIACFGGSSRLRKLIGRHGEHLLASGQLLSGREAAALKLVDFVCCERRARMELRSLLDRLELRPVKPRPPVEPLGLAAERRAFAAMKLFRSTKRLALSSLNPVPAFPGTIGLLGDDDGAALLASRAALRESRVVVSGDRSRVFTHIDSSRSRGFITPLEAEQARLRVRSSDNLAEFRKAELVFVARSQDPFRLATTVLPRVVVCVIRGSHDEPSRSIRNTGDHVPIAPSLEDLEVFPYPRRVVQVGFQDANHVALFPGPSIDPDTIATLQEWFDSIEVEVSIPPRCRANSDFALERGEVNADESLVRCVA